MEYREDRAQPGTGRGGWNYPDTSITLLGRLKASGADVDDAAWARFVDVYGPVVHHVVRLLSPNLQDADVDDIVQDVFVRLVGVLRSGAYDPNRAKFRTFLSTLARRLRRALAENDIPFDRKRFTPHITLVRRPVYQRDPRLGTMAIPPAAMEADRISLMLSTRGKSGMIYTELGAVEACCSAGVPFISENPLS